MPQRWVRLAVVGGLAALAAACSSSPPPEPPPPADPATACLETLDTHHITYQRLQDWLTPEGCGIAQAVRVARSATEWNRPAAMTCQMADTVWRFETEVVLPAARTHFRQGVRKMWNAGSYDCRGRRSDRPNRMSEHAFGRAIDITGFQLDDGTVISVRRDWHGQGAKAAFLREVADGACRVFNVVITPNHNVLHRDHLHLDIGPFKLCGN